MFQEFNLDKYENIDWTEARKNSVISFPIDDIPSMGLVKHVVEESAKKVGIRLITYTENGNLFFLVKSTKTPKEGLSEKIYNMISKSMNGATIQQISNDLNVSRNDARGALNWLLSQEIISYSYKKQNKRGRPAQVFKITC